MLKMHLAAGLATAALMTTAALAQTSPTPSPSATQSPGQSASAPGGSGQVMTEMSANLMRGSKLMGVDVYGSDNEKIGDIDEVLLDREGKVHAIVVGIGGFLGIGEKNVAIPYNQVQWMTDEQARTAAGGAGGGGGGTGAGGVTTPASPTGQPATTGSTGAGGTTAGGAGGGNEGVPARAMVRMSKADLQNAPEFRYTAGGGGGGGGGTNPPANPARPGTAPQQ